MQEPIENGRGQHLIVEDLTPIDEALVRGDDRACLFVPPKAGRRVTCPPKTVYPNWFSKIGGCER